MQNALDIVNQSLSYTAFQLRVRFEKQPCSSTQTNCIEFYNPLTKHVLASFFVDPYKERTVGDLGISQIIPCTASELSETIADLAEIFIPPPVSEPLKTESGTVLYTDGHHIGIDEDGILWIQGVQITHNEIPLLADGLSSEPELIFIQKEDGNFTIRIPEKDKHSNRIHFHMPSGAVFFEKYRV